MLLLFKPLYSQCLTHNLEVSCPPLPWLLVKLEPHTKVF